MILGGRVSVNGSVIKSLSFQVDEKKDDVRLDGKPLKMSRKVYYVINKPKGVISAVSTPFQEQTVVEFVKEETERIYPVGRLDKDSEGLLFLTNDGDFAFRLTHPRFEKEKTYEASVSGKVTSEDIADLRRGVNLGGGESSSPALVRLLHVHSGKFPVYSITLKEGKNRQIRRMFEAVGASVVSLKRVSEGGVGIEGLRPGQYRRLTSKEVAYLSSESEAKKNLEKSMESHPGRIKGARAGEHSARRGSGAKKLHAAQIGKPIHAPGHRPTSRALAGKALIGATARQSAVAAEERAPSKAGSHKGGFRPMQKKAAGRPASAERQRDGVKRGLEKRKK
jgi:23S rRNA pseudouridine2605 synthase